MIQPTFGLAKRSVLFLAAAIATVSMAFAADTTGGIGGVVKDATSAVAPSVALTATNTGTNAAFKTISDSGGNYAFRSLPVGLYDVSATASGFKRFVSNGVRVQVNELVRVDVSLQVGDLTQTVDVSGQVAIVDTTSATLRTVVDQQRIETLPLNGRNVTQLMQLVAGVIPDPILANVTSDTTYPGVTPVSVNGGRANTTNYILDGGQNNDHYSNAPNPMPNPDALQEFSVQTNNFSAEYGRSMGGIVNAVTKSGTNDLHGSAFWYIRNHDLNAANRFAPALPGGGKEDDGLERNQFGATIGGPVMIPKLYNGKNKTFFLYSYQGTRLKQAPTSVEQLVPTAAQRVGDFSKLGSVIRNPTTGQPYGANKIPTADFNPISQQMLGFIPTPAGGSDTISFAIPGDQDENQHLVKIDHELSSKNRFSVRFWDSKANQPAFLDLKNYLTANPGHVWRNTSVTVGDTHIFTPGLLNSFIFGFNRMNNNNAPITPRSYADLGMKIYSPPTPQWNLSIGGYFDLDTNDTNTFFRRELQFSDTVRWTKGRHSMTMGGELGKGIGDIDNNFRANGEFTFSPDAPFTGNGLADFMVGKFSNLTQGIGEYKNTRFTLFSMFFQDSYKFSKRLTIDIGLRWEPFFPYTDANGKLAALRSGQQSTRYVNAPKGILYPGDAGIPDGGYDTRWKNFGPRIGFAYDIFGDGSTSIRGGYGIFYDRPNTISTNSAANQAPFGTVVSINGNATNNFTNPYAGATNPFPAPLNPPSDVRFALPMVAFAYTPGMRNGNLQGWNLALERQLVRNFVLRVAYAGSKGTHLVNLREGNPATYAPGVTTATTNARRPLFPNFGNITLVEPGQTSIYNSLQVTTEKRFSRGFSFLMNYTWSRSIDTGSFPKQTGQTVTSVFNIRNDRGISDFHRTHVMVMSGLWELPIHPKSGIAKALIGGWNLNGIVSLRSGFPLNIRSGVDNARTGTGNQRVDIIGNPYFSGDRSRSEQINAWLNKAAFAPNALGTFGNLGRNAFYGPGFASTDLGLLKDFVIRERFKAQFRFEAFNAFNRVNLLIPNRVRTSGNFLRITEADSPRILQFAVRFAF